MDSTAHHKPDPEPVRFALAALGSTPDNALFLGDSPHDIAAGQRRRRHERGGTLGTLLS